MQRRLERCDVDAVACSSCTVGAVVAVLVALMLVVVVVVTGAQIGTTWKQGQRLEVGGVAGAAAGTWSPMDGGVSRGRSQAGRCASAEVSAVPSMW